MTLAEGKIQELEKKLEYAECRVHHQMRAKAQPLKDALFIVASALATQQTFNDTEINNLRSFVSEIYDELCKLGLMYEGELRYRKRD